jgi:hypothetical protein
MNTDIRSSLAFIGLMIALAASGAGVAHAMKTADVPSHAAPAAKAP